VIRSHVIQLDPTDAQEEFFRRCVGTARFAYNWALNRWRERFDTGEKPNEAELRKELNSIKDVEFPWMYAVPKSVVQQAIKNLGIAYQNFFDSIKGKRKGPKMSMPDFKSRHRSKASARLEDGPDKFSFDGNKIKLPKIGWIKMREELRFEGRPISTRLSFQGQRWWISVQVELPDIEKTPNPESCVGIDLGLTSAITLSTGEKFEAPRPLRSAITRLKRLGRRLSRKVKGSQNRKKAANKLSRLHWKVAQTRKGWQHEITTAITKRFSVICVEDLNVSGMMKNHCLARAISDVGWGEIVRQLGYKADAIQEVDRFFPSSKTCSGCGFLMESLPLSVREWACPHCGRVHDRDENAAENIRSQGLNLFNTARVRESTPGETGSSGIRRRTNTKLPSMNQELMKSQNCEILVTN
jgi:putative transposase